MMRISSFFYTLGQGFKNLTRNGWYTLASIATITACLFLFGIFYSILANFQNIVQEAENGVAVTVFFQKGTSDDQMLALKSELEMRPEVRQVDFESATEAWEEFKVQYLGEYAEGYAGDNPLADSSNLQVYLNDVSRQASLVSYLESVDIVRVVNRSELAASALAAMNRLIALVSMTIIGLLVAVSVFLINNTIAIGISIRSEEINIMKYIGATDFFVRAPFVVEGIIIGLIGSLLPLIIVYVIYGTVVEYLTSHYVMLNSFIRFLPLNEVFGKLAVITLIIGIGIGFLGSVFTVRRHLRV